MQELGEARADMEQVKVICCDIDGTLVRDDKSLSEVNKFWIKKAVQERGVQFTLVSGRMYNGVRPFYDQLGIWGPISCYNGGTLYDKDGQLVEDHRVAHDIALRVLEVQRKTGVPMILFNDQKWYLEKKDDYLYPKKLKIYQTDCIEGNFEALLDQFDTNKLLFMSPDKAKLDEIESLLRAMGMDKDSLTFYRSTDFLELMPYGVNKGTAIDALSRHFKISPSEIMAIGDDYNDIAMLKKAGFSVAVGNAVPEAKAAAKYLTASNQNDGVAKAIQNLVFGV